MEDWFRVPDRRRSIPHWRLCLVMGVTFLTLWVGAPMLFALAQRAG
ncbi:MAG: hypothetical protein IPF96_03620 [Rhodobacter sp.]|nr:hypothetical protein [Rhodobacter sp.]